jgi:hypothetical protein
MKGTLALLVASTALTAPFGAPASLAMQAPAGGDLRPVAALLDDAPQTMPLVLASGDDDDDHHHRHHRDRKRDSRHDDDDDDECDDDDDDDDDCRRRAGPRAPAGTIAPPQNGLFGNGAPPKVQVN